MGPARRAPRRRRVADGRLAAQPGRAGDRGGNSRLVSSFRATLPDLQPDDVIGSPTACAVTSSTRASAGRRRWPGRERAGPARARVDPRLRAQPRGARPPVDHRARRLLHPGTTAELDASPAAFLQTAAGVLATARTRTLPRGRMSSSSTRSRPACARGDRDAGSIGDQCDGVRCDMAMLMTNEVFARTWGERAGAPPGRTTGRRSSPRSARPTRASVHRRGLLGHGVDAPATGLRFLLRQAPLRPSGQRSAESVRGHLQAAATTRRGSSASSRTTTNRAPPTRSRRSRSGPPRSSCRHSQGARLYHAGQLEGLHTHIPVFLARGPQQSTIELRAFYEKLLGAVAASVCATANGGFCQCSGWPDNQTAAQCSPGAGARTTIATSSW